jgi:hypothetical protein
LESETYIRLGELAWEVRIIVIVEILGMGMKLHRTYERRRNWWRLGGIWDISRVIIGIDRI